MNTLAEETIRNSLEQDSSYPHGTRNELFTTLFLYRSHSDLLSPSNLQTIANFEFELQARPDFQKFCQARIQFPEAECDVTTYQDTFFSNLFQGVNLSEPAQIQQRATLLSQNQSAKSLFDTEFSLSNLSTKYARSIITFAGPIAPFENIYSDKDKQDVLFVEFLRDLESFAISKSTNEVDILLFNSVFASAQITTTADGDLILAIGSFILVYIYVTIHLRSLILSTFGMFQTLLAFPLAYFIYYFVFRISYYSTIHMLTIFIILGVAADDFFVFNDAWRQTAKFAITKDSLDKRMALSYRRASKAMFVTSFTTASAFLATGFSDIMTISSFGFFAATLIVANYVLVITLFPAFLIIWHRCCSHICDYDYCCDRIFRCCKRKCCLCKKSKKEPEMDIPELFKNSSSNVLQNQNVDSQEEKLGCLEHFCLTKVNSFVRIFSPIFVILLLAWMGIAAFLSSDMKPLSTQETWLPPQNRVQQAFELLNTAYPKNKEDNLIKVTLFWGVSSIDKSQVSIWDDVSLGTIRWDPNFTLSHPLAQSFFLNLCQDLQRNQEAVLNASYTGGGQVTCFMSTFKLFVESRGLSFPISSASLFLSQLQAFTLDASSYPYRNAVSYGFQDNQLVYASIDVITKTEFYKPSVVKDPVIAYWNDYIASINQSALSHPATSGLNSGKVAGGIGFAWTASEKAFVSNAVQGMMISGFLSFLVLLFSTCNAVVAFYAILGIAGVIVSVVSIMNFSGWEFGVAESIAVVILIGFSVDYVVHLANHYVESLSQEKHERMKQAYGQMGISIFGGALTTFAAGAVLFGAKFVIFKKFATLITSTVIFSLIYSLLFFGSLSHFLGPQKRCGSLYCIFCCHKCRRKKRKASDHHNSQKIIRMETAIQDLTEDGLRTNGTGDISEFKQ